MDKCSWCCISRSVEGPPSLEINRLALRPFMVKDALSVRELANTWKIRARCLMAAHAAAAGFL